MVDGYNDNAGLQDEYRRQIYTQRLNGKIPDAENFSTGLPNFYTLHYDASRVNFASHQRKTLDLASYLRAERTAGLESDAQADHLRTISVAIIGGGIGGLTCFLALHAMGFCNVHLFEMDSDLLSVQKDCFHRHGHPTAIDWPKEPVASTTDLPILNWGAGTAHSVTRQMQGDRFEAEFLAQKEATGFIHKSAWVEKMILADGAWELVVEPAKSGTEGMSIANDARTPNIIINAQGFGVDQNIEFSSTDSYWWEDNLANSLRERNRFNQKRFVVLGRGDGALIDFARAAIGQGIGPDWVAHMLGCLRSEMYQLPNTEPCELGQADIRSTSEEQIKDITRHSRLKEWARSPDREEHDPRFHAFRLKLSKAIRKTHGAREQGVMLVSPQGGASETEKLATASMGNQLLHCTLFYDSDNRLDETVGALEVVRPEGAPEASPASDGRAIATASIKYGASRIEDLDTTFRIVRNGPNRPLLERMEINDQSALAHYEATRNPSENRNLGAEWTVDSRKKFLEALLPELADPDLPEAAVAWDYRYHLLKRHLCENLALEDCEVGFLRDEKGDGYLKISAPIVTEQDAHSDDASAQENHDKMIHSGGYDRIMFGGRVAWHNKTRKNQAFTARSVPSRTAAA